MYQSQDKIKINLLAFLLSSTFLQLVTLPFGLFGYLGGGVAGLPVFAFSLVNIKIFLLLKAWLLTQIYDKKSSLDLSIT